MPIRAIHSCSVYLVPPITIAAVGSSLSRMLTNQGRLDYALTIMIASYIMDGVGLLLACGLMIIYFQRLALHKLPPRELIVSTFLPLGPCGQGGFALIELVSYKHMLRDCARNFEWLVILYRAELLCSSSLCWQSATQRDPAWPSFLNLAFRC